MKSSWKKKCNFIIIRYRNYTIYTNSKKYKRATVTLHVPFRNEEREILPKHRYLKFYDDNTAKINKGPSQIKI